MNTQAAIKLIIISLKKKKTANTFERTESKSMVSVIAVVKEESSVTDDTFNSLFNLSLSNNESFFKKNNK